MGPGVLDKKCRIEIKASAVDPDYGTEVVTWTLLAVRWCNVQDELPSRSEALKLGVVSAAQRARVRMNYATDFDSTARLIIMHPAAVVYQIISGPAVLGVNEGLEMMVEVIR